MIKLIGSVLIIFSCSIFGIISSNHLKLRCRNLEKIISSFLILESEISYGKKDIKSVLFQIGKGQNLPLFCEISENIANLGVTTSFLTALEKENLFLTETDTEILIDFSKNLGSMDTNSQKKSINHAKNQLKLALDNAKNNYEKLGKLYRNMGFLFGLFFTILLI